ncbi:hypothetical protein DFR64_0239 [Pelolinea submarina]|uniref:Glycosyltransferase RgtA/B/C/D-like domain-containing protein n=1 Tax=Pelolinea submarina TaxID=913107 RepID=A0A3E0AFC3_9CHLR|nr:hypothetical protein DFR64_0239 [Pelolinea submarina]
MKWWRIFLGLFSLETLSLLVNLIVTGSAPSEQVLFNLSLNRLILATILIILIAFSIYAIWRSLNNPAFVNLIYSKPRFILIFVFLSFLATGVVLFLISLNPKILGDFYQAYLNLKPFLIWGFVVTLQSWLFSMVWFCHHFLGHSVYEDQEKFSDELVLCLGLFFLLVLVKQLLVIPTAYGPVIRGDEMRYFEMANYLFHGNFFIENINHSPFLYPLMLSPAFAFGEHAYDVIKLLNVLYSSSIVFPLFLIARKYFSKKESLLITGVACFLPYHLLFPRILMSENLYFPILLWIILSLVHQPRLKGLAWIWNFLTGIGIGLLYMTRYITLAIIPLIFIAWWLIYPDNDRGIFHPSVRKLGMALLVGAGTLCGYSPWLFSGLAANVPIKLLLGFGITSNTTANQLTLANFLIWLVIYLCYFILMAAPVMPFFFAFPISQFKKWKKETRDWYILLAALMVGFLAACVRHSWRAIYNGDIPTRIMGRYILYFTPLFIIAVILAFKEGKPYHRTTVNKHLLVTIILPLLIEIFAHYLLLGNLFHLHDGDLINILGSVDAAYIQYLGSFFFILLLFIYGIFCYLTWEEKLDNLVVINLVAIMLFFVAGLPAYYRDLLSYQEYQYIGAKIIELHQSPEGGIGDRVKITTPPDAEERDRALLSNTFHFSNQENFYVDSIKNFNLDKMPQEDSDFQDIYIVKVAKEDLSKFSTGYSFNFGDSYYVLLY